MFNREKPFNLIRERENKILKKTLALKAILGLIILLAALMIMIALLIGKYIDEINRMSSGDIAEAKKVGNWELIDSDYILKGNETVIIDGKNVGAVTIRDNKNGNKLFVFEAEFTLAELSRIKEETLNKLLESYGLGNSYFKGSGATGKYGQEIIYNIVGWKSVVSEKTGIIGSIDCSLENGNKSSIFLIAVNIVRDYNNDRVLTFANTLKCPDIKNNSGNGDLDDKLDTDKDGLTDNVEKMLHTDPYNADSDEDGTSDGDEIKVGRNPSRHKQWQDVFTAEEFDKVKKDIKFISIYNYDKLFTEN